MLFTACGLQHELQAQTTNQSLIKPSRRVCCTKPTTWLLVCQSMSSKQEHMHGNRNVILPDYVARDELKYVNQDFLRAEQRRINYCIQQTNTVEELNLCVEKFGYLFDHVNVVTSLVQLANMKDYKAKLKSGLQLRTILFTMLQKQQLSNLDEQGIPNCLWALAKLGLYRSHQEQALFFKILKYTLIYPKEREKKRRVKRNIQYTIQGVVNIFWAMNQTQIIDQQVVAKLSLYLMTQPPFFFGPKSLSSLIFQLGKMDHYEYRVVRKLIKIIKEKIDLFNGQQISNVLYGLKLLRHYDKTIFKKLQDKIRKKEAQLSWQDAVLTLSSISYLRDADQKCVVLILDILMKNYQSMNFKSLSNVVYSLGVLNYGKLAVKCGFINLISNNRFRFKQVDSQSLQQLYYSLLLISSQTKQKLGINKEIFQQSQLQWQSQIQELVEIEHELHLSVAKIFRSLKYNVHLNCRLMGGDLVVNMIVENMQPTVEENQINQFAVQILDHNCFTISRPLRMLGPTLAKIRLIERQGFKVITVPFFDWDRCQDFDEQAQYLRSKIRQASKRVDYEEFSENISKEEQSQLLKNVSTINQVYSSEGIIVNNGETIENQD
eukprot:TRINITY_DN1033_c1_g1_i1.p1 TRINITY_DN1033_c1_g1~~TRINITY_DN1033_c1_g1_i1.p1  ORF type:complete len:604 (+),score=10.64 TRINITY_DN1033_c1_g1_i1:85-1896(+)